MTLEQIISYIAALGLGGLIGVLVKSYVDFRISNKTMLFEAREKAYAGMTGRIFNLFLEPDITSLRDEALIFAKVNALLSEVLLLGSNDLVELVGDFKNKLHTFHKKLAAKDESKETKQLHSELVGLAAKIFDQMRKDLSVSSKSLWEKGNTPQLSNTSEIGGALGTIPSFGSFELSKELRQFLLAESSILMGAWKAGFSGRAKEIQVVLASCCNTASAIAHLGEHEHQFYNEAIMLARAFIEKIINFCYLLVCDDSEYDRFLKYSFQKGYRKLDRQISIGDKTLGIKFTGNIDTNKVPGLAEALSEFTSQLGKEKTHWTKASVSDRLALISQKTEINVGLFMLATLSIYEDASEALHGTLYGSSFHTWAYQPEIDHHDARAVMGNTYKNWTLIYFQLGTMINEILKFLARSNDIQEFAKKSAENDKRCADLIERAIQRNGVRNS